MKNRALVFGGAGQLGTQIRSCWNDWQIDAPSHSQLDIENLVEIEHYIVACDPLVVINCADFHNVDRCEDEPDRAFAINAIAVDRIAAICTRLGKRFVTLSTDYVFDGSHNTPYTEVDEANPLNAYGVSKRAGESLALRHEGNILVARTCGLYGLQPSYTFIDRVLSQSRSGFAGHVADALRCAVESKMTGIVQVVNQGPVSWFEFASTALRFAAIDQVVIPVRASE